MCESAWVRLPAAISDENDRRVLTGILTAYGLEVRIVRIKTTNRGTPRRYIEYRDTGLAEPVIIPSGDVNSAAD